MALYIAKKSGTEIICYVGESIKNLLHNHFSNDPLRVIEEVAYIQADGHELDHIVSMFTNERNTQIITIPIPRQRVVIWTGDISKTILLNL